MGLLRTLFISALITLFALQVTGCGLLISRGNELEQDSAGPEEEMPAWLALSHRSLEDPDREEDRDLPQQDVNDGGDSEDQITAQDPSDTAEPSGEAAASQPSGETVTTEPEEPAADNNEVRPGTMEWLIEQRRKEIEAREAREKAAEDDDEDEEKQWWELGTDSDSSFTHDKKESIN